MLENINKSPPQNLKFKTSTNCEKFVYQPCQEIENKCPPKIDCCPPLCSPSCPSLCSPSCPSTDKTTCTINLCPSNNINIPSSMPKLPHIPSNIDKVVNSCVKNNSSKNCKTDKIYIDENVQINKQNLETNVTYDYNYNPINLDSGEGYYDSYYTSSNQSIPNTIIESNNYHSHIDSVLNTCLPNRQHTNHQHFNHNQYPHKMDNQKSYSKHNTYDYEINNSSGSSEYYSSDISHDENFHNYQNYHVDNYQHNRLDYVDKCNNNHVPIETDQPCCLISLDEKDIEFIPLQDFNNIPCENIENVPVYSCEEVDCIVPLSTEDIEFISIQDLNSIPCENIENVPIYSCEEANCQLSNMN